MATPSLTDLLAAFADPSASCRPQLQWSWNGDIQEEQIDRALEQFRAQGIGGFFTHARPGLLTPYLSERWFQVWDHAMRRCAELGMEWHLYDEFTAGGGTANGHSYELAPHAEQKELAVVPLVHPKQVPGGGVVLASFRIDGAGAATPVPATKASADAPLLALVHRTRPGGGLQAGRQKVDLYHPDATRAFLESTHERYRAHSGDGFGTTVRFCFNDEPHTNQSKDAWCWSPYIRSQFEREHDYDLQEHLLELCFDDERGAELRYDYFRTLERLYNTNFCKAEHDWCEAHGLLFTGHFMEHEWPRPISQPSSMSALRWMQAPGNDLLGPQFKDSLADNAHFLLNLTELTSVGNQFARHDLMVESCGAGGWDKSFALFKTCEDFLLAFRINVMDPHLAHYSVAGARKGDFPQSITPHSPWFGWYRHQADHVARVIALHQGSVERNRVLVLHPTRSGWLHHRPKGYPWDGGPHEARLDALRADQDALLVALYRAQIDCDLGEEALLEEAGAVDGDTLRVGAARYQLVVIPAGLETWSSANTDLLEAYLAAGGRVVQIGEAWQRIDGRISDRPATLRTRFAAQWETVADYAATCARVRELVPPRITAADGSAVAGDLVWRRSELADGSVAWFVCNPWQQPIHASVAINDEGPVAVCETATGSAHASDRSTALDLDLPPRCHRLIIIGELAAALPAPPPAPQSESVAITASAIDPAAENALVIDFCDVESDGKKLEDVPTFVADEANWRWQGWPGSPWPIGGGSAHLRDSLQRAHVEPDSWVRATYRFTIDETLERSGLALGIERPWRYRITVNDRELDQDRAQEWFDVHARRLNAGDLLQAGENVVVLEARPFHMQCEIAAIVLLGDFALEPAERGFTAVPPRAPALGDWTQQGYPFHAGGMRYRYRFSAAQAATGLRVRCPDWQGSLAVVELDGQELGPIMHPPYERDFACELSAGEHELTIQVIGNMQNVIGPHFVDAERGVHMVPHYKIGPEHMPPGTEYKRRASGLLTDPQVALLNSGS